MGDQSSNKKGLKVFKMACLRKIEGVTKRDGIQNTEIRSRLNWQKDINKRIQQRRLKYFGHVARMNIKICIRGILWAGARNKEEGQAKEKVGAYNEAGLQRNACEVVRCHPDDTQPTGVEEVRGKAADARH